MKARAKYQLSLPPVEVNSVVPGARSEGNALVLKRRLLRESIDEAGWKHEAVAAALAVDPPYLSKMLAGEKPITLRHLDALPNDVETIYATKYAEHFGLIVVQPAEGETAIRNLVSGLFGVLGARRIAS